MMALRFWSPFPLTNSNFKLQNNKIKLVKLRAINIWSSATIKTSHFCTYCITNKSRILNVINCFTFIQYLFFLLAWQISSNTAHDIKKRWVKKLVEVQQDVKVKTFFGQDKLKYMSYVSRRYGVTENLFGNIY